MANPSLKLRQGTSGESYQGSTPGHVLTIDLDGESVVPAPGGGGGGGCVSSGAVITGAFACAENLNNTASGDASHAEGSGNTVSGFASHAEGSTTIASGDDSHAEGSGNTASGFASHAEGSGSSASGDVSHAEGASTAAIGQFAHAANFGTTATGFSSTAVGSQTVAEGEFSFAEGKGSKARMQGDHAHASGHLPGLEAGANQWRYTQLTGTTPGLAPGESVQLLNGSLEVPIDGTYYITVKAVATRNAVGAGARQAGAYERRFIINCNQAGVTTISTVVSGTDILVGATFVGATLVPTANGDNTWSLTFTLAGGVTAPTSVTAHVELTELVGFTG